MSSNEVMVRLEAAVRALGDADVAGMPDDALREQLAELSVALCEIDAQLVRLAEGVRARGYVIVEEPQAVEVTPDRALASV